MPVISLLLAAALTLQTPDLTCRVRDKKGHLVRSMSRRALFMRLTGYPKGRPGYIVDHWIPLACNGMDGPNNMQWLTVTEWKAKTAWERRAKCRPWWTGAYTRLLQRELDRCKAGTGDKELCDAVR